MRVILLAVGIALGVILASPARPQNNPGFNPNLAWGGVHGSLAIRGSANWQGLLPGTAGQALLSGGPGANPYWSTITGTGTVTSVSGSGGTTGLTLSGGPITGAGTLTLGGTLVPANGGTGAAGAADTVFISNGTIGSWGTIGANSITAGAITNNNINASAGIGISKLAAIPSLSVVANITGGNAVPTTPTVTALFDNAFGSTQGQILYRGASGWVALNPGSSGEFLRTNGAGANPQWQAVSGALGGTVTTITSGAGITSSSNPITVTGTLTGNAPFRNRITNGNMIIAQRTLPAASGTSTPVYTLDRWYATATGASVNITQSTLAAPFPNGLRFTGAASNTSVIIGQRIESTDIQDLAGISVTLSAYLACSNNTTITWSAYYPTAIDNYASKTLISSGTFDATTTRTRFNSQITLPSNAVNGVAIEFSTAAFTSGTCDVTGVQLEPGSIVTPFEAIPIASQWVRAQRYYETGSANYGSVGANGANGFYSVSFAERKRIVPTMTSSGGSFTGACNSGILANATATRFDFGCGFSAAAAGSFQVTQWAANAEIN